MGLDAQASSFLNDLYTGAKVPGRPVYLAMAMDEKNQLKLEPHKLLLTLTLARRS